MKQSKTGNYVPAPATEYMATYTSPNPSEGMKDGKGPYKGSGSLSQKPTVAPADKMATYTSPKVAQSVKGANVKRTGYSTPSANLRSVDGGRGPGGY